MLTLNRLDAIDADRLHRKLGRISSLGEELSRRRYRLQCRGGVPASAQGVAARLRGIARLSGEGGLQENRLFPVMNGNRGVGVIADRVGVGDVAKNVLALDDMQSHATVGGIDAQHHVMGSHNNPERAGLVVGHLNELADFFGEAAQFVKIDHRDTPRN